jgi:hypothetical protein
MKAYVINLDSRPDRWLHIQRRFRGSNISLERISAVRERVGAYGNFRSFIKALKMAQRLRLPNILILEDDCVPREGWMKLWPEVVAWLDANPDKWDIYSGGAWQIHFPKTVGRSKSVVFYDPAWSVAAHWLYIPERAYAGLIDYYTRVSGLTSVVPALGIDVHNNAFKTVVSYPFMAYQEDGFSNIKGTRRNLVKQFKNAERGLRDRRSTRKQRWF